MSKVNFWTRKVGNRPQHSAVTGEEGSLEINEPITTGGLNISVSHRDERALVCLNGRLTIDSSPELRNQLLAVLRRQSLETLTIDLADVPYIDCAGIATLVEALKIARRRKASLQLRALHDRPRYLFEVTGLLSLFEAGSPQNVSSVSKAL